MIVKKLAVPLINEKVLQQAEHVYIATAAISEGAFDFIKSRLLPKCKIDIVTGLDSMTSPEVLKRIWKHYQDRITLRIYSRNTFHANAYIFDLPFRKAVAFTGSGTLSLEGLKDQEEIFNKTTDPKEIEALMSWYTGYFEFAEPLSEAMVNEYELIYPFLKQNEIVSKNLKKQFKDLTTGGFRWDNFKFKKQYFKKEDYLTFENAKAELNTDAVLEERKAVQKKLIELSESLKPVTTKLKLFPDQESSEDNLTSLINQNEPIRSMSISFGRKEGATKHDARLSIPNSITFQVHILQSKIGIYLVPGLKGKAKEDREYFKQQMLDPSFRNEFLKACATLGEEYWIQVAGDRKSIKYFTSEDLLMEFTNADQWKYYDFVIGRNYSPGDNALSTDSLFDTIESEFNKLEKLNVLMKKPSK